jgi:hypothetical protein
VDGGAVDDFWTALRAEYGMMPVTQKRRREELFVVHIWMEAAEYVGPQWRALVMHVKSRERRYFTNYRDLCEFLEIRRERD